MTSFKAPMNAEILSDIYQKALRKCMNEWKNEWYEMGENVLSFNEE